MREGLVNTQIGMSEICRSRVGRIDAIGVRSCGGMIYRYEVECEGKQRPRRVLCMWIQEDTKRSVR